MTDHERLAREFRAFTRYLTGGGVTPELVAAYDRAHRDLPALRGGDSRAPLVDRASLALARLGGPATRVADAYTRFFRPAGPLRVRLVLTLALLEHAPPHHERLATAVSPGPVAGLLRLTGIGIAFAVSLGVGLLVLGPLHLVSRTGLGGGASAGG